jgi:hypothetical protein
MGTEEEVRKHEEECYNNYDLRSCTTCIHKKPYPSKELFGLNFKCGCGIELPTGKMMTKCPKYEREESTNVFSDMFGGLFGGLK